MAATRPRSSFCHKVGLDYVSCSPYRVPIARLAAAQAALRASAAQDGMTLAGACVQGGKRGPGGARWPTLERDPDRRSDAGAARCRLARARARMSSGSPARRASASRRWRGAGRGLARARPDGRRDRRRSVVAARAAARCSATGRASTPTRPTRASFVRSMAARDRLGGLADLTLAAMVLMRALFDRRADRDRGRRPVRDRHRRRRRHGGVLRPAGLRRFSLQFMKAGIVEIPHLIVVTKADLGAAAERARADVAGRCHLPRPATMAGKDLGRCRRAAAPASTPGRSTGSASRLSVS